MPYQLHCEAPHACCDELLALLGVELATEFFELDVTAVELFELDEVVAVELDAGEVEQTAPVIVGISAAEPFLSPCTPKLTDWPG